MDADLRTYLEGMEERMTQRISDAAASSEERMTKRIEAIDARLTGRIESLAVLISDVSSSLHREISELRDTMVEIQRRLDRQGGLLQTGARHTTRMFNWAERVDLSLEDVKRRIQLLEYRRDDDERRRSNGKPEPGQPT